MGDTRTAIERQLDEESGGGLGTDPLDVLNDPTAPLLDDGPSEPLSTQPEATDPLATDTQVDDPLATDVPESDVAPNTDEEAVEEEQPQ